MTLSFFLPILTSQNPLFETHPSPCLYTSNSHDYTAALPCYESIIYEIKHRKSFILPILSHKFGMYN